ncbi:MAG TPA: hypothetical protein DEO49_04450 [Sutterella sp.]|jgi:regulator of replication initiation timing|nr:hypothetical protein [Sutterella sp.]
MKEQIAKLEDSVLRLLEAFNALKQENAALKATLEQKTQELETLRGETDSVRTRIDQIIESLESEQN